jgi:hypothetical protein
MKVRPSKDLAYEIGLYRIALFVHAIHDQMKMQSAFAKLFNVTGSDARLTYSWWVVLGGNKLSNSGLGSDSGRCTDGHQLQLVQRVARPVSPNCPSDYRGRVDGCLDVEGSTAQPQVRSCRARPCDAIGARQLRLQRQNRAASR